MSPPVDDDSTEEPTPVPVTVCEELGLPERPWVPGADPTLQYHRRDLAPDLVVPLLGEEDFLLNERWSGCDNYVFLPDSHRFSPNDATDLWEDEEAIAELLLQSPRNVHWFFYSQKGNGNDADASIEPMADRLRDVIDGIEATDPDLGAWWRGRSHVVSARAERWEGWAGAAATTHAPFGFGVDRHQIIRGVGSFSDVRLYDANLPDWPWANSLAMATHEPAAWNHWALERERMDLTPATVIPLWTGETLAEFADTSVVLPSATEMAAFNRMEIEVQQACPNAEAGEAGNCGAWDYLAYLFVEDAPDSWAQLGRFITSYHRETNWVVDASALLPLLAEGGAQSFRWSFAPSWNTQPTRTWINLRLWNDGGAQAQELTPLWTGGAWNANYNTNHAPLSVAIPSDATRVELFAIITGHGMDAPYNCAEFCGHRHVFTINGQSWEKTHEAVGDDQGCIAEKDHGMTPNQWGTWWLGRGGWCPGEQVEPFIVDLTEVSIPGTTAELSYEMYLNAASPSGTATWGNIDMVSWLVVSR